ncbi:MAG: formylglycine-generating enzyme family protein, partial [Hyphomicrobiaceae bacterium]
VYLAGPAAGSPVAPPSRTESELIAKQPAAAEKTKPPGKVAVAPVPKPALPPANTVKPAVGVFADARTCKPGDSFKDCEVCPEMVVVRAGRFTMGSPANEPERFSGETQVAVTIAKPFAVGKYEATFAEWDACVADGGCRHKPGDGGWGRGKQPVIDVSWDDAKEYVAWLSAKTGQTYRLLTEAEWEYTVRAGTTTPFWWGSSITPKQANYGGNYTYKGGGLKGEYRQRTIAVDSFAPNSWGLYNVHGNVWEWTEDCWNDSNDGNSGDGTVRTTGDCALRVVRGGSWGIYPWVLRAAFRVGYQSGYRNAGVGFRVARTLSHP